MTHRRSRVWSVVVAALSVTVAVAGCSSSGGGGSGSAKTASAGVSTTPSLASSTAAGSTAPAAAGDVPDPCTLLTPDQVRTFTGEDPGTPSSSRTGSIFATERTCSWDSVITFVGLASDYASLQQTITKDFGAVQPVQGVGQAAFWDPEGNSMAARNDRYFVMAELTGPGSSVDENKQMAECKQILAAMLAKL